MRLLVAASVALLVVGIAVSPEVVNKEPQVSEAGNIWDTAPRNEG
ncbi:hypothetical protein [Streptomyces sp. NPDC054854]